VWYLTGAIAATKRLLKRTQDGEREQMRRLNEAYARWARERHKTERRDPERDRRLLGTRDRERNDRRER
jgi:hypothetical protein